MNIVQLKTFIAVVDEGSFSAAARAMGVSQPAVTMQVKALEDELGVILIDRHFRKLHLTDAGVELVSAARAVLVEVENVRERIADVTGVLSGVLTIAASTTPGEYIVPGMLAGFFSEYPRVRATISVMDSADVILAIQSGEASVGFTGVSASRGATFTEFATDELVVVAHPTNHLAGQSPCELSDLLCEPWVMRESGSGTQATIEKAFAERGVSMETINTVVELGSGEAILNAVEGNLGIAIVSSFVAKKSLQLGTVVQIPLAKPILRPLYIVTPTGTAASASLAFSDYMLKEAGKA